MIYIDHSLPIRMDSHKIKDRCLLCVDDLKFEVGNDPEEFEVRNFDGWRIYVYSDEIVNAILKKRFVDIDKGIRELKLLIKALVLPEHIQGIAISQNKSSALILRADFSFDFWVWNKPWTVVEYIQTYSALIDQNPELKLIATYSIEDNISLNVCYEIDKNETVIEHGVLSLATKLEKHHSQTVNQLLSLGDPRVMTSYFNFPDELRIPCEQYLLYFIQFLKDLGVDASANIRQQAGQIMFSVTPDSEEVALDKIREALHVYLNLPAAHITGTDMVSIDGIRIQQLTSNIQHLHSQITLANAVLQMKDATILAHETTIGHQQQLLDGTILSGSFVSADSSNKPNDKEELFGGLIKLGELEKGGIHVSLAELYRRGREFFKLDK